jgi:hypothetical protein
MPMILEKLTTWVIQRRLQQDERDCQIRALNRMNRLK